MRIPTIIMSVVLVVGFVCGCTTTSTVTTATPLPAKQDTVVTTHTVPGSSWDLLPLASSVPVDFREATVVGTLDEGDQRSLVSLIGRLKGVYPKIHHVTVSFPDRTVAALVKAGPQEIYCVKDIDGHWSIVAIDTWIP